MSTLVRIAENEEDKNAIYAFRYRIYVDEFQLSPAEADYERKILRDDLDDVGISYVLWRNDQVVGSLRTVYLADMPNPGKLIGKFGLAPAMQRFGVDAIATTSRFMLDPKVRQGRAIYDMMDIAYRQGMERGVRLNYGDCSPHLLPFYKHLGYRRYTRAYNDTNYGYKLPILMLTRDHAWFTRVKSPLARVVMRYPDDTDAREWFAATHPAFTGMQSAAFLSEGAFYDLLQERVGNDPLHSLSLLSGLDRKEVAAFLEHSTLIKAEKNDRIIRQGQRDETVYVLLSGIAEVLKDEHPDRPIRVLGAGDCFGEIGYLTNVARTANVVACAPCEVLVLSSEFLQRFLRKRPEIAIKVLYNFSRILAGRLATDWGPDS
ncbi:MAG TPA: cyclic nucleotide-binding domain-containing protein [Nitrococcus sp.]|nr:cyclic nucleotide-binding domain-containing protein [Nitrococcus sp.]